MTPPLSPFNWRRTLLIGALGGVACALYMLVLYLVGENPLGRYRLYDVLLQIGALALATFYYQRYLRPDFDSQAVAGRILKGFAVSFTANLALAFTSGLLTFVFLSATPVAIERYLAEVAQLYEVAQQVERIRSAPDGRFNPKAYDDMQAGLVNVSAVSLACDDSIRKLLQSVIVVPLSNAIVWTYLISWWLWLTRRRRSRSS